MESYLKGRGFKDSVSHDSSSFRGLFEDQKTMSDTVSDQEKVEKAESEISTIHDEKIVRKLRLFLKTVVQLLFLFICLITESWNLSVTINYPFFLAVN